MAERNANVLEEKRIEFRIEVNLGDIIIDSGDIFGNGVNAAVRLEGIADPGGICASERVKEYAQDQLEVRSRMLANINSKTSPGQCERPAFDRGLHFDHQGSCAASPTRGFRPLGGGPAWSGYRSDRQRIWCQIRRWGTSILSFATA
jgi:hypothetical protein